MLKRAVSISLVIVVPTLLWWLSNSGPASQRFADLQVYLGASEVSIGGGSLYDYRRSNGDVFTYPPFAAIWFIPISFLGFQAASAVVFVLNVLSLTIIGMITASFAQWKIAPKSMILGSSVVVTLITASAPGRSETSFGQISTLLISAVMIDWFIMPSRFRGYITGICAAIKLTPLVFLLVGGWRWRLRLGGAFLAGTLVGALIFPQDSSRFWLHEVFSASKFVNFSAIGNQSLMAVLQRLNVPKTAYIFVMIFVAIMAFHILRKLQANNLATEAFVLAGVLSTILSPISWTHHRVWTIVATMILFNAGGMVVGGFILLIMMVSPIYESHFIAALLLLMVGLLRASNASNSSH